MECLYIIYTPKAKPIEFQLLEINAISFLMFYQYL